MVYKLSSSALLFTSRQWQHFHFIRTDFLQVKESILWRRSSSLLLHLQYNETRQEDTVSEAFLPMSVIWQPSSPEQWKPLGWHLVLGDFRCTKEIHLFWGCCGGSWPAVLNHSINITLSQLLNQKEREREKRKKKGQGKKRKVSRNICPPPVVRNFLMNLRQCVPRDVSPAGDTTKTSIIRGNDNVGKWSINNENLALFEVKSCPS